MLEQLALPGLRTTTPSVHNLFLAVLPEPATAARIARLAYDLSRKHRLRGNLLEPNRLHVSLLNLGAYQRSPSAVIERAMEASATIATEPFTVEFDRAGSFRGRAGAQPLVLLARDDARPLMTLQQSLVTAIARSGIGPLPRSSFTPHLTVLYGDRLDHEQAIAPVSLQVREFVLIDSLQGEHRHDRLGEWRLRE